MRLALLALGTVAGCVAHAPLSDDYAGPQELPIALVDRFDSEPLSVAGVVPPAASEPGRRRFGFTVRPITLLSNAASRGSIEFDYYDVHGADRTPVVVVLPIFNGQPIVTRYFARYFAHQGWAALALDRERDPLDHLADADRAIRDNLLEYRRVLDWIAEQPELDSRSTGIFGISLGAMDAVMLMALDDRVDALVAAMAGGDLAHVFMSTTYRRVSRAVDGMLEETGLSRAALEAQLNERFSIDPWTLGPYVDAERVLMIMTRRDAIVPFETQQELRARIGAPETLYLPTGHRTSIVYFPLVRSSAYEFFARQFADMPSGDEPSVPTN